MARVIVIGAGFAGHTAALYLRDELAKQHEVVVVNPYPYFLFVPSLVWVGTGRMDPDKTHFSLKKVYEKKGIQFVQGRVTEIFPDEKALSVDETGGTNNRYSYDYLLFANGPKLNFAGTEGLGPEAGNSWSICNLEHATQARDKYLEAVSRMEKGEKQRLLIGTGHPGATCQGAAFEYISNIHKDLEHRGVRDKADLIWLSNERDVGDFGVRGLQVKREGAVITSREFIEAAFKEYGIEWHVQRGVKKVEAGVAHWENYAGEFGETKFDFAMLIPQFTGVPFKFTGADGSDVSGQLANPAGFIKVDAQYGLPYEELAQTPEAWPGTYQNPTYNNIFAAGIAFAPPGPISIPHKTKNGTSITAAPPRTGMVSGITGRVVAKNIADLINYGEMKHSERMTEMFAACIASMGNSLWDGSAATLVIYPVVPDFKRYPNEQGRDPFVTHMEMGLAGAWMKRLIHSTFMHKLQGRIGWKIIPE